jgi:hypothetical protein
MRQQREKAWEGGPALLPAGRRCRPHAPLFRVRSLLSPYTSASYPQEHPQAYLASPGECRSLRQALLLPLFAPLHLLGLKVSGAWLLHSTWCWVDRCVRRPWAASSDPRSLPQPPGLCRLTSFNKVLHRMKATSWLVLALCATSLLVG